MTGYLFTPYLFLRISFRYLLQPESYTSYIIIQRLCVTLTLRAVSNLFSALVIPTGFVDPIALNEPENPS